MGEKYISLKDLATFLGVSEKWVYRKSKELKSAKALLNGKPIRPTRFDRERVLFLLRGGSLIIEESRDLPNRKVGRI